MSIDFKKLGEIQENFKQGNLGGGISGWDFEHLADTKGNMTLNSIFTLMDDDYIWNVDIGKYRLDALSKKEKELLKSCTDSLKVTQQFHKESYRGGNVMFVILSYNDKVVKIYSYNDQEHSGADLSEEDLTQIVGVTTTIYQCVDGYETMTD